MKIPPLPPQFDQYQGWVPPPTNSSSSFPQIPRVPNTISKQEMWDQFISKRRPVIIQGHLPDSEWKGHRWTDLEYLRKTAGSVPVKIEPVHPTAGHFGTSAKRKKVVFSEFLDILQDPTLAGKWYLTTQYDDSDSNHQDPHLTTSSTRARSPKPNSCSQSDSDNGNDNESLSSRDSDDDDEPELDPILPSPTSALSNDFPQNPDMLSSLALQQCNLWLGNSRDGKSSGLHHDFHDNLYILLSGYKRFLLFPPSAHSFLHPRGHVERVHTNGLIVYAAPGELPAYVPGAPRRLPIRPDGLVPSDAARWRRKARLRIKQEIDERAAAEAGEGNRGKRQRKGKARQTREQELAEQALQQAETELTLCKMDEQGIQLGSDSDDSDDSDDDEGYYSQDLDSDDSLDSAQMRLFAARGGLHDFDNEDEQDDDDDDSLTYDSSDCDSSVDHKMLEFLDTVPLEAMPLAQRALEGDEDAFELLQVYMTKSEAGKPLLSSPSAAAAEEEEDDGEDSEDDDDDEDKDSEQENRTPKKPVLSNSSSRKKTLISNHPATKSASSRDLGTNGNGNANAKSKRKREACASPTSSAAASLTENLTDTIDEIPFANFEEQDEDDNSGDDEKVHNHLVTLPRSSKKVKISDERHIVPASNRHHPGSSDDDSEQDSEDDEDEDEENEPLFPMEPDSGSEFGDVEDGEAQLARLLVLSTSPSASSPACSTAATATTIADTQDEPASFSQIHPSTLHRHFGIADDPCSPSSSKKPQRTAKQSSQQLLPLSGCPTPIQVFLSPGEMLYLPASWYHEVTSSASRPFSDSHHEDEDEPLAKNAIHMAFNYWFHPPDALTFQPAPTPSASASASVSPSPTSCSPAPAPTSTTNHNSSSNATPFTDQINVPGVDVEIGESARENLGSGTGCQQRPYRDAEVWDQIHFDVTRSFTKTRLLFSSP